MTFDPAANDADVDGDPLTVSAVSDPANGTAVVNPDGTVTYTPDPDFNGTDTFTYTVSDGNGGTDTGTITVDVTPVVEPLLTITPGPNTPLDGNGNPVTSENGDPVELVISRNTPDDEPLTVFLFNGDPSEVSLPMMATIPAGSQSVTVTVDPVDDDLVDGPQAAMVVAFAPGFPMAMLDVIVEDDDDDNVPPMAEADVLVSDEDSVLTANVLDNDTDEDGDTLTVAAVAGGTVGSAFAVTSAGGRDAQVTVTETGDLEVDPAGAFDALAPGETDTVSLTYTVSDGNGGTDTASVDVTVTGVNDAPVIVDPTMITVDENEIPVGFIQAFDPDGPALTFLKDGPDVDFFDIDEATGQLQFLAPPPDFEAPMDANGDNVYELLVSVSDGLATSEQTLFTVTVGDVNEAPEITNAVPTLSFGTDFGDTDAIVFDVEATDPEGGTLVWSLEQTGEAIDADLEINAAGQITQVGGAPLNGASGGLDGVINLTVTVTDGEFEDSFDLVLDGFVTVA